MGKHRRTCLHVNLNTVPKRLKKNIDSLKTMFIEFYIWKRICRSSRTFIWGNNLSNFYLRKPSKFLLKLKIILIWTVVLYANILIFPYWVNEQWLYKLVVLLIRAINLQRDLCRCRLSQNGINLINLSCFRIWPQQYPKDKLDNAN